MKIAILQDDFPPQHEGGTGIIAYQLAQQFSESGHDVLVITTVRNRADAGTESTEGFRVVRLHSDYHPRFRFYLSLCNPRMMIPVQRLLKSFAPDVVHVHNVHFYLSYCAIAIAKKYARAVIMTAHDTMSFCHGKLPSAGGTHPIDIPRPGILRESLWEQFRIYKRRFNPWYAVIVRLILRTNVTCIIAVSDALKQALIANNILCTRVIRNGINLQKWIEPLNVIDFKKAHGIGNAAILFGGRLSAAKGAYQILAALAEVQKKVPDAQLLIVGKKDSVAQQMIATARSMGIVQGPVFLGWLSGDELRQAYYASAIVVVPSLYLDPFPTVNLEAFACQKPVVATCFGGSPEIVADGSNGYVVNPLDTAAMARAIVELLSDVEKRKKFGAAGFARVQKEFLLTEQAAAYERVFTKV